MTIVELTDALNLTGTKGDWTGFVQPGYDVFGIPHGGYMAALGAHAILKASQAPDLFTVTTHYLRKASFDRIKFRVDKIGASRRFATWSATGTQGDKTVIYAIASVGDRDQLQGPTTQVFELPPLPPEDALTQPSGREDQTVTAPGIAERGALRLEKETLAFSEGRTTRDAVFRGVVDFTPADQLAALIACDIMPPVAWNLLGPKGWVPTLELTAHVRARTGPGPWRIQAETRFITDGFLDEDALVMDQAGRLIVQARQLARWTST